MVTADTQVTKQITLTMDEETAKILKALSGNVVGTGKVRTATDAIYSALDAEGVPSHKYFEPATRIL